MSESSKFEGVTAQRVAMLAAGGRVLLDGAAPERIAHGTAPQLARFAAENIAMPMEIEPATFIAIAHGDIKA